MTHILHFTLGPVQGFVGEARRTRDLWAGSFLLSWLSAQAMWAVTNKGGTITFPAVKAGNGIEADELFQAVSHSEQEREKHPNDPKMREPSPWSPYIGSIPNRFKAEVDGGFEPEVSVQGVKAAWKRLADAVWEEFVAKVAAQHGARDDSAKRIQGTQAIWDRQIENFWDIAWVKGPLPDNNTDKSDGAWLDQRKNWRSHYPEYAEPTMPGSRTTPARYQEGGDHCQLMGFFQELSGFVRAKGENQKQKDFWNALREVNRVGNLNLRDNERLCAIALVKRLFPVLPRAKLIEVMGWVPGEKEEFKLDHWPSVSYIAAVPWLQNVWKFCEVEKVTNLCADYTKTIDKVTRDGIFGETAQKILGLEKYDNGFFKLDGHFFHRDAIRSMDLKRFKSGGVADDEQKLENQENNRLAADAALKDLHDHVATAFEAKRKKQAQDDPANGAKKPVKTPPLVASEFYAVLIADGDDIGKYLRGDQGETDAKIGLAAFTKDVPGIVTAGFGVTNYAGGDDVLALLPLDHAIEAAIELRIAYAKAFDYPQNKWTLSAAIVFAQYKIPFRAVLAEAHRQLDKVAKEKNGRDSLALAVMKPGGVAFDWVSAWSQTPIPNMDDGKGTWCGRIKTWRKDCIPGRMLSMARALQADREFTTGFLYNIRERYGPLYKSGDEENAELFIKPGGFEKFLRAEYKKSGGDKTNIEKRFRDPIVELMTIGFPLERTNGVAKRSEYFSFDAGLVMRFLAEEGRWFMGDKA